MFRLPCTVTLLPCSASLVPNKEPLVPSKRVLLGSRGVLLASKASLVPSKASLLTCKEALLTYKEALLTCKETLLTCKEALVPNKMVLLPFTATETGNSVANFSHFTSAPPRVAMPERCRGRAASRWLGLGWNRYTTFHAAAGVPFGVRLGVSRRLQELEAASLEALLRELLIQFPQKFPLRFWPRNGRHVER